LTGAWSSSVSAQFRDGSVVLTQFKAQHPESKSIDVWTLIYLKIVDISTAWRATDDLQTEAYAGIVVVSRLPARAKRLSHLASAPLPRQQKPFIRRGAKL
jgi:hypothetical protein